MIRLQVIALNQQILTRLAEYQLEVDNAGAFGDRVDEAKRLFSLRNKPVNTVFREVRRTLVLMCPGAMRCVCCASQRSGFCWVGISRQQAVARAAPVSRRSKRTICIKKSCCPQRKF